MVNEGPTEDELAKAKAYLKGSYALNFDTSTKIASILLQNQLDDLGIDYIDKRNGLMDAVTIEDARRAAKRLAEGGLLVTVVGQPKGSGLEGTGRLSNVLLFPASRGQVTCRDFRWRSSNRSTTRGRTTSPRCWHAPARRWPCCARATPTARCRCCGFRKSATTSPPSSATRRCCATARPTWSSSAPAARASAARRWRSSPATPCRASARCAIRRASISWTISIPTATGALLERLPLKTSRFVAVSKSGGTGETLMQTIAALDAVKAAKLDPHDHFLGITEPAKPGKANGLRDLLARPSDPR